MRQYSENRKWTFRAWRNRGLTHCECEILRWFMEGKRNSEIAVILGAKTRTVGQHVENILPKLNVETRTTAAADARRLLLGERSRLVPHDYHNSNYGQIAAPFPAGAVSDDHAPVPDKAILITAKGTRHIGSAASTVPYPLRQLTYSPMSRLPASVAHMNATHPMAATRR